MLATVSELSMFQSKALKLQQEKEEKEQTLESAVQRLENGMAPTDSADAEWEKKVRDSARREQDRQDRIARKQLENSLPPNGVKTTALPRPNSYMPPDI
jgi:exonuclease VII small subunit